MHNAILAKLIQQAKEQEELLFTLHRDCGDQVERNHLGVAWISAKETRLALEWIATDRERIRGHNQGRPPGVAANEPNPYYGAGNDSSDA